ncbi:MAG: acyl carrier protein [Planctomycetes bacterium]|nr:acyl carrier protein [Planctomycetota bacterium]
MSHENRSKLNEIIATLLEVEAESLSNDCSPETIEHWDSLNHLNICVAVEQEFGITLTTDEMVAIRNVGDLVALLNTKNVVCA